MTFHDIDHPLPTVMAAYSIHSQLPSKSAGRLLHPQPKNGPCRGKRSQAIRTPVIRQVWQRSRKSACLVCFIRLCSPIKWM